MKNTILMVISALLTYVFAECLNLAYAAFKQYERIDHINSYSGKLTTDEKLGYKLKANLDKYLWITPHSSTLVSTDELGFRNVGRNYSKADIVFVGDSFVEPQGVEFTESFHYQLGLKLEDKEVISFATSGWAVSHYNAAIKNYWHKVTTAEQVVLVLYANDFSQVRSDHLDPEFWQRYFEPREKPSLAEVWSDTNFWYRFNTLFEQSVDSEQSKLTCQQESMVIEGNRLLLTPRTQWNCNECYEESVTRVLLESFEFIKAQEKPNFNILLIPSQEYIWQDKLAQHCAEVTNNIVAATEKAHEFVQGLASKHGFNTFDVSPHLLAEFRKGNVDLFIANDGHLSREGHLQVAVYLKEMFAK